MGRPSRRGRAAGHAEVGAELRVPHARRIRAVAAPARLDAPRELFRALLDPRTIDPGDVYDDGWAVDFESRIRSRTTGDGRVDRVVELLSADGWLSTLYRVRELVDWAWARAADPELTRWDAGKAMPPQERWDRERSRLKAQCRQLAAPWEAPLPPEEVDDATQGDRGFAVEAPRHLPQRFVSRVRRMLELWRWAVDRDHPKLAEVVRGDLRTVVEWAAFAYDIDFDTLDRDVGNLVHPQGTSMARAIRPNRHAAREELEWWLEHSVKDLNTALSGVKLEAGDVGRFLDYLDACELWAWSLDLSRWTRRRDEAADTRRDEGFLHLRSACLLLEPLLGALAHDFGTEGDRTKIETGKPMQVFLVDRPGWRTRLWQTITQHEHLTKTHGRQYVMALTSSDGEHAPLRDVGGRLSACIEQIDALSLPRDVEQAAKQILVVLAIRHFGAHRFSRDEELLELRGGRMAWAIIYTAVLYWKLATKLG